MAKKKSVNMSVFAYWINVISNLIVAIKKLGGTEEVLKNFNNQNVIDEVAKILVGKTNELKLKFLTVSKSITTVTTSSFSKSLFTSGPVKYYIWENFQNWILNKASEIIPAYTGTLRSLKLTKSMNDSAILAEIGESNIFSIDEACAISKALTERQQNGESGDLLNNGHATLIYVRLVDLSVVPVSMDWDSVNRKWSLFAYQFDDGSAWGGGRCVIVRG